MAGYINELAENMKAESKLSRLSQAELAAFLIKKTAVAVNRGIMFEIEIDTDLKGLSVPSTKIVAIIGNAFYAVSGHSSPQVRLTLAEDSYSYKVTVSNNGPETPEGVRDRIFENGYTTKGSSGSGYGLYISKNLVEKREGPLG